MAHGRGRTRTTVAIIGAGYSGICAAIDLIRHNKVRDFVIIEKGLQVGGTWNDNTYPGCCCDVHSHLYSYSFEPNPDWSREYSPQEEIQQYMIRVAQKWRLFAHIRFNSAVSEAHWDEKTSTWDIHVDVGGGKEAEYGSQYMLKSNFLIAGVGQLNQPCYPDIKGLRDFTGKVMHSARWDWEYSFEGKRVGIIGNGATAAQIIPEIAKQASTLEVFQRTPNWVIPRNDDSISMTRRMLYRYIPHLRKRYRAQIMDMREGFYTKTSLANTDEKDKIQRACLEMMERQIPGNISLREKLTPDYPAGCKRVISSDDFYPALNQPHVLLETSPITRMSGSGIWTNAGKEHHHELDCLILATGFMTHEFVFPMKFYGRGGRPLRDIWTDGAQAFRGVTVADMPNFGMLYGPNTNLGHNSIVLMIEAQSRYLNAIIGKVIKAKSQGLPLAVTPKTEIVREYNHWVQQRLTQTSFTDPKCNSWYKTADGKVLNNWCGNVLEYQQLLSRVDWDNYDLDGSGNLVILRGVTEDLGRVIEESSRLQTSLIGASAGCLIALLGALFMRWQRLQTFNL